MEVAHKEGLGIWLLFGSENCTACIEMTAVFNQLQSEYEEQVYFIKVDVYDTKNKNILVAHDIRFIPTSIFIDRENQVVLQEVGIFHIDEIRDMLHLIAGRFPTH